jgi:copper resistance protein D
MLTVFLPLVIVRWIQFAAVFVLFGSSFFWLYMGSERFAAGPGGLPRTLRATVILLRIAAPIAALSAVAWIACLLINMTSDVHSIADSEDLRLFFFETPFGAVSFLRLTLLAVATVIVFLPWHNRARFVALLIIGAILLITQAWFGHSADSRGLYRAIMIMVYGIHTLAAAAWVGGLPPLLLALIEQRRSSPLEARESALDILARFSLMAMTAVSLLVASGAANAIFRVNGSLGKLFDSAYGDMLFKKLVLVAAMLAFACVNRFILMPKLRTASLKGMVPIVWLRNSVTLELVIGILVLGASATLGITMPPQ